MNSFSTRVALCRGALTNGTPLRLRIRGTSMMPALRTGDTVSVHRANLADCRLGDVVVFTRSRHLVAHRVVSRTLGEDGVVVVTRGDACRHDDLPLSREDFLGVVKGGAEAVVRPRLISVASVARHALAALVRVIKRTARAVAPQYVARGTSPAVRIDGGALAVISESHCEIVTLNEVGAAIWLAADGLASLPEIVERVVCGRFDVEPHVARRDAETFVAELLRHGILVRTPRPIVNARVAAPNECAA